MKTVFLLSFLLVIGACNDATEVADDVARRSAKATVSETLVRYFPAIPSPAVTTATDCVIDNSDLREVRQFAGDAVTGADKDTVALTATVLQRPDTQQCMGKAGLTALTA